MVNNLKEKNINNPLILIADDSKINLTMLSKILEKTHFRVVAASTGKQALKQIESHKPDLILLDILMPEMNGFEVSEKLKATAEYSEIPIIFLTAKTEAEDIVRGFEVGAVDYLTKPFNSLELLARVKTHLELKQTRDALKSINLKLQEAYDQIKNLNQKLEDELKDARAVQFSLLPKTTPALQNYQIAGTCIPAAIVGGDFYDFTELDTDKTAVFLGDVSGKGMPAALLMAECRSILLAYLLNKPAIELSKIIRNTNNMLYKDSADNMFITCLTGILEHRSGFFEYCNAGHNPPFLYRNKLDEFEELNATGTVLGFLENLEYEKLNTELYIDDVLVIYSDGITEAQNTCLELFEERRLADIIRENHDGDAELIKQAILSNVTKFSTGAGQYDDITLVIIKRTG